MAAAAAAGLENEDDDARWRGAWADFEDVASGVAVAASADSCDGRGGGCDERGHKSCGGADERWVRDDAVGAGSRRCRDYSGRRGRYGSGKGNVDVDDQERVAWNHALATS